MANEGLTQVRNLWQTQLTADVSSSATTLPVVSTSGMPTTGIVVCGREAIYYAGLTSTSFTGCIRGLDSTATAHAKGGRVRSAPVAAHHNDVVASLALLGSGSPFVACTDANNQAVANNTITDTTWATEVEDTFGMHAAGSANFVIPTGMSGLWVASVVAPWASGGTGTRQLQIYYNGGMVAANAGGPLAAIAYSSCSALFRAAAGATVKVIAYQDSGGSLNLQNASATAVFRMGRVGT